MKLDGNVLKMKGSLIINNILGVKEKPLDGYTNLKTKHLYFLVQLPLIYRRNLFDISLATALVVMYTIRGSRDRKNA